MMSRINRWLAAGAVALGVLVASVRPICAAEIPWRYDYASARREAEKRGLPLIVDFRTTECPWCDKLELETLRDPTIMALIMERFIPVKINHSIHPELGTQLNIEFFPTVIMAGPDGRILGTIKGFQKPPQFQENVQRALAMLPSPKPPEAIVEVPPRDKVASTVKPPPTEPVPPPPPVQPPPPPPPAVVAEVDILWRNDYNLARREAQEKGMPLVLDFRLVSGESGTKPEKDTLRDALVARLINDQFVPLRIDAGKDAVLAQSLKIQKYPTVVLAAPDGRILGTYEGQQEPARFQEYLQRALSSVSNPEWMLRDYQSAAKAIANADVARAITLLKAITADGNERPVQIKARQLLQDLEQQAAGRLARARMLDTKGQTTEAMETISELMRTFAGTQAAAEAAEAFKEVTANPKVRQQQRTNRARELLGQAREDYRTQQYLCCLDRCELLAGNYGDLPEGIAAMQLAGEIKSNPDWLRKACEDLTDRLSVLYLARAETCLSKGQQDEAIFCLDHVLKVCPGTRQAELAKVRMAQIQGQSTVQTDYSKP